MGAALAWWWPALRHGAAGLFTRLTPPELLDNRARAALLALIAAEPGIHAKEIERRLGLG